MGLNKGNKVFSTDILRVEVSGPSQPHLVCKPSLVPFLSPGYLGCCSTPGETGLLANYARYTRRTYLTDLVG
jgi:hypothetical protein